MQIKFAKKRMVNIFKLEIIIVLLFSFINLKFVKASDPFNGNSNDITLIGNIDDDENDEVVFFNRAENSGVIRAMDIVTALDDIWINWDPRLIDFIDPSDQAFLEDINDDKCKELILVNSSSYNGLAFLIIDFYNNSYKSIPHGSFLNFFDTEDEIFIKDINSDRKVEAVLINKSGTGTFIKIVDFNALLVIKSIFYNEVSPSLTGWLDPSDKMLLGIIDDNYFSDLLLINTSYNSGAIRAIELMTKRNFAWINHGSFDGLMDDSDKIFLGDINNDTIEELVFMDSDNTVSANLDENIDITAYSVLTSSFLISINNRMFGSISGWNDECDKQYLIDVTSDGKQDFVMINIAKNAYAIRVIDLETGYNHSFISRDDLNSNGWMDLGDKLIFGCIKSSKIDLFLINTSGNSGFIRALDVIKNTNDFWINYSQIFPSMNGWLDGNDNNSLQCSETPKNGITYDKIHICNGLFQRSEKPANRKLYTRDQYNIGRIKIAGFYNYPGSEFIRIKVEEKKYDPITRLFTINILPDQVVYLDSDKHFQTIIVIPAGLIEYTISYFNNENSNYEEIANNVLCGDAFVISGQSNAAATDISATEILAIEQKYGNNEDTFFGKFSRTFSRSYLNGEAWNNSTVVGYSNNVGVWGLKLQYEIQRQNYIPTLLINNAVGGTSISQHVLHTFNPFYSIFNAPCSYLNGSILSRAYYAGVENNIKGIIWFNGEAEVGSYSQGSYLKAFDLLYNDIHKYLSCDKTYQFQISTYRNSMGPEQIRGVSEEQRILNTIYNDVIVLSSNGCPKNSVNPIHFSAEGYEQIGERIFNLIQHDIYNLPIVANPYPINVVSSWKESNLVHIEFDQVLNQWYSGSSDNIKKTLTFYTDETEVMTNDDLIFSGKELIIKIKPEYISQISDVGYGGYIEDNYLDCYLRNDIKVGALSFDKLHVQGKKSHEILMKHESPYVFPNPVISNLNVVLPETKLLIFYKIFDMNGYLIKSGQSKSNTFSISFNELSTGTYKLNIQTLNYKYHTNVIKIY